MSVIKRNLNRLSSFNSVKSLISKPNSLIRNFSEKKNTNRLNRLSIFNLGSGLSKKYSKEKQSEIYNLNKSPLKLFQNKEEEKTSNKQTPRKDFKSLIKSIKSSFINKYNTIYYEIKGDFIFSKNNKNLLYDYFKITDILENKKCTLVANLNEFNVESYKKELLIRYYKPKERYIIMKYLLNFIYKYDKLCYDESKEIDDLETKEDIIKTFYYITSEQYIYEHLFENDSFKEMQNLLKKINLANKKASYDYSYLDMTKNAALSQENEVIINSLKIINEYINNRSFLERKLIKNFPIEKVPNIVPNYCPLGIEMNKYLENYRLSRKNIKIENHEETKNLINKYQEIFRDEESKDQKKDLLNNNLFQIKENIEENETGKSEVTSNVNKSKSKFNYKKILSDSMNNISGVSNKKESSNELKEDLKMNDIDNNKATINEIPDNNNLNKRLDKDPETKDIEYFLEKISNNPKKIKINYINKREENKSQNIFKKDRTKKSPKVKFRMDNLKLQSEFKNNEKDYKSIMLRNFKLKNKLIKDNNNIKKIDAPIKKRIPSAIHNFRESSLKIKQRKINNNICEKNIINSPSFNISSSLNNELNYIIPNLSSSFKIHKRKYKGNIFQKNTNSYIINHQFNKINNYKQFVYNKFARTNKSGIDSTFKDTQSFVKESIANKNKITLKQNITLKNFITILSNDIPNNKSVNIESYSPSSKSYYSLSPKNTITNMRRLYKKTDFEKLVFQMNKRLLINKKKESKSNTFQQILKNCEIYNTKLN